MGEIFSFLHTQPTKKKKKSDLSKKIKYIRKKERKSEKKI